MVEIINKGNGVSIENTEKFIDDIEKRVFQEWTDKKIHILSQGNMSNSEFKVFYDGKYNEYKKELKKLLRTAYKNVFNPLKTLEGLEYIWYKNVFIGVLSDDYVIEQRDRMYKAMEYPTMDIKNKVNSIKQKINKRFKK